MILNIRASLKVTKYVSKAARGFATGSFFVSFICCLIGLSSTAGAQAPTSVSNGVSANRKLQVSMTKSPPLAFACSARDVLERFPIGVSFQITNLDQLETSAKYEASRQVQSATLKRVEIMNQDRTAIFPVGGYLGISGEAKILISKEALKVGEVGTLMMINQSTRESVVYQCQKITATAVAAQ